MSDREMNYKEKARSGLLRRDPILTNALSQMRRAWTGRTQLIVVSHTFHKLGLKQQLTIWMVVS